VLVLLVASLGAVVADTTKTPQLQPSIPPTTTHVVKLTPPITADFSALSLEPRSFVLGGVNRKREIVSVPNGKEEKKPGIIPNPTPSSRKPSPPVGGLSGTGPKEVSGVVRLTIYNCTGRNGGFCPDRSHTASGTVLVPGTAACDRGFMGRRFRIVGDPENITWTCLDRGDLSYLMFDLWFYNLNNGLNYLAKIPGPYQVVFVD